MKKFYILFLIALFSPGLILAQVTFTQTTTDDFEKGHQNNVLVNSGNVVLPDKGTDPGTWISTTSLPSALTGHDVATYKDWAFLTGGFNGSSPVSSVYRGALQSAGIGSWTALESLPAAVYHHAVVVGVSHIYVLGGIADGAPSDQIYYAELHTDGSIGNWQTSAVSLPNPVWGHTAAYLNGYIYVVGGADESGETDASAEVYVAGVDPLGQLTEFSPTVSLPAVRNGHTMVSYNNSLYILGGFDNTGTKQQTVFYSGFGVDGGATGWLSAQDLPVAVSNHSSVCYNGLISVICGDIGEAVPLTRKVYYAEIDESPSLNWTLSVNELYYRRKDGVAIAGDGQIIFLGGEELTGTPIAVSRYAELNMSDQKVEHAGFVSYPFALGSDKTIDNLSYNITYSAGDNDYEILYRYAGTDAIWSDWVSAGQDNPVSVSQSKSYLQYKFDFSATNDVEIEFHDLSLNVSGYTQLSGDLNSMPALTLANSPYWATDDIWFTSGTHTIEAGVTIVFSPNTGMEIGQAEVNFEGVEGSPIQLTFYNTETGQWKGVYFNEDSDAGVTSTMSYTTVENAGMGSRNANLYCYNTNQPLIENCTFRGATGNGVRLNEADLTMNNALLLSNSENGLHLTSSDPELNSVEMNLNNFAGIYYASVGLNPIFSSCTIESNTYGIYSPSPDNSFAPPAPGIYTLIDNLNDIAINEGTISADRTWSFFESGYAILGTVSIKANGQNPRLTIDPGTTLRFDFGKYMKIGGDSSEGGELYAEGTSGNEITFTSLNGEVGGWNGLVFDDGSDSYSSSSSLKYCIVENGVDYNLYSYLTQEPFILYSTFQNAASRGIYLNSSDIAIEETLLNDNGAYGLYLNNASPSLVLVNMDGNATAGVYYGSSGCDPTYFSCQVSNSDFGFSFHSCNRSFSQESINGTVVLDNIISQFAVPGGTITASRTWDYIEYGYAVLGTVSVYHWYIPRLTIAEGNTLRFAPGKKLEIAYSNNSSNNDYRGELFAEGTEEMPVIFKSLGDTVGGWGGIAFYNSSDITGLQSSLKNCIIEQAATNLSCTYTNQPEIDSCTFKNASSEGIYCYEANLSIDNSLITNNATGVRSNSSLPVFTNCEISDNELYEVYAVNPNGFPSFENSTITPSAKNGSTILVGGGVQSTSRTWPYFSGDYVVSGSIEVYDYYVPVLTIAVGNTIKFDKNTKMDIAYVSGNSNNYRGRLFAEGTEDQPILFTALNDSTGGWDGLHFNRSSNIGGITSSLKHCTIEKASENNIYCNYTDQPTIDSCVIKNSGNVGISFYQANNSVYNTSIFDNIIGIKSDTERPLFSGCEIYNNETQELWAVNPNGFPTFENTTLTPSAKDESVILVGGGVQTVSRTWPYFPGDYVVSGSIEVYDYYVPVLTIAAGNTIKFDKNTKMDIAYVSGNSNNYRGRLFAEGTEDQPIIFTALNDSVGGWDGLWFNQSSNLNDITSSLKNCTIEKASSYNVYCNYTNQPTIDSCVIKNSGSIGLYFYQANNNISNTSVFDNAIGIKSDNNRPVFNDCAIFDNETHEVWVVNPNGFPTFNSSTINTSATGSIILVGGGHQTVSRSWPYFDGDYEISGSIEVYDYYTPVLTISAGNTIKFEKNAKLDVAYTSGNSSNYRGVLIAEGTADEPIVFTALNDSVGGWTGISFNQSTNLSGPSSLKNCIVEKADGFNVRIQYTNTITVDSSAIKDCAGYGMVVTGASPVIKSSQIINNGNYGIYISGDSNPVIGNAADLGCDLFGNGTYDIYNDAANNIDARYNFWNTLDSLLVAHRIFDKYDNSEKGEVYFSPFSYEGFNELDYVNRVSGNLMYANADSLSLAETKLYIITENNVVKDSTTTDILGDYLFDGLSNSYCQFTIPDLFGDVNATDALLILQHFAHVITLEGIKLQAADVNGSNTVNGTDALFVMKRFVHMIDEFPVGDWIIVPEVNPLILYQDTVVSDLLGLCYGDVNASFLPDKRRKGSGIELIHETEMVVSSWQKYRIPVRIKNNIGFSAASLELSYPAEAVRLSEATLIPNQQEMVSHSGNGITRYAWADLNAVTVNKNEVLIELILETEDLSGIRDEIEIEVTSGSEIADKNASVIQGITLSMPQLAISENENRKDFSDHSDRQLLMATPNPFNDVTTITYSVPEKGHVSVILQKVGSTAKEVLVDQEKDPGRYRIVFDGSYHPDGIYVCILQITGKHSVWTDSQKLILNK